MEVLISMGILAIGLASVVALVPAGKSQATKASIYDRGSVLAANVLADGITRGLLRPSAWNVIPPDGPTLLFPVPHFLVFDTVPLGESPPPPGTLVRLRTDAATSGIGGFVDEAPSFSERLRVGEDDLLYSVDKALGVGPDDPPVVRWLPAQTTPLLRASEGGYSSFMTLQRDLGASWKPGELAMATVVVCHRRDPAMPRVRLNFDEGLNGWRLTAPSTLGPDLRIKDLLKPGAPVLSSVGGVLRWHRVLMVNEIVGAGAASLDITFEGEGPGISAGADPAALYVFPGAVTSVSKPVRLEGTSAWNR
jgi:hypothetical protein